MSEERSFHELIATVRRGDPAAQAELFQRYGPIIQRIARIRILNARLGHVVEPSDIRQEVLKSFFAHLEDFDLGREDQVRHLLEQMARHKVENYNRRQHAECRDREREERGVTPTVADGRAGTPSEVVGKRELSRECWQRLSPAEQLLYQFREEGRTWEEIAQEMESSPEALRKRYERALERVRKELDSSEGQSPVAQ